MSGKLWSQEEVDLLSALYPDAPTKQIAEQMNRTEPQIYNKARSLGLKKSDAYLAGPYACRLRRGDNVGAKSQFKPGTEPWNKGKAFDSGGRSHETRFKPGTRQGRASDIYKPVGTERLSKEGYLERKINEAMPFQKRWRAVHILNWEAVNGPLPPGHCVIFKDGNKINTAVENLELITRADNMQRNTLHRYPKEITDVIRARAVLNRRINHVEKHQ